LNHPVTEPIRSMGQSTPSTGTTYSTTKGRRRDAEERDGRGERLLQRRVAASCGLGCALAAWFFLVPANGHVVHGHGHDEELHFSHPLLAESPSPDTKARLDYTFAHADNGEDEDEHEIEVELELALHRTFSVEVGIPVVFLDEEGESSESDLGNIEVGLKFANYEFERHGLLLGYGIEFGLPTGDDSKGIGSNNEFEFEPFLDVGYKRGHWEVVSFVTFAIPVNQEEDEEVETELGYNLSLLYHVNTRLQALLELEGETVLSGEEDGDTVVNLQPAFKVRPVADQPFLIGVGVAFPLTNQEEFDVQTKVSSFYHF